MTIATKRSVDGRGKTITTFVVFAAATELERMAEGEELELLTDEFEPFEHDIKAWCLRGGHVLRISESIAEGHRFVIEKGSARRPGSSLAMVISTAGLEELLSPLGFALGAALEGVDVHLYFQGPAVKVLTDGFQPRLKGWGRPFTRFAAKGMANSGHVAAREKLDQIRQLGGRLYLCGGSIPYYKVSREDVIYPDVPVIEYLSFVPIMEQADIQLYI
ncbi:MAG: DsrE family protein [Acidimicrobiia bacterium]|nr:DsrE family protein [Acidimicrobiia bacterium]